MTNRMGRLFLFITTFVMASQVTIAEGQSVKTAPIIIEAVEFRVRTFGVLAPSVEDMSFQIPGRIASFHVSSGERVTAGQLLVRLDTADAEDTLRKARTELENAERLLNRMQKLSEAGSIQSSQLDDAQAQYDQVRIAFEQAELNLERCSLLAPSDGLILKQNIDSRTSVLSGQPIFVFQSDDEQWVTKVDLTDRNALLMSEGAVADVIFAPYPNEAFSGKVTKVAKVANPSDGLYTAEVTITTNGLELRPGMVAEVDLRKASTQDYAIVPFDALLDLRRDRGNIYLVGSNGATAVEMPVTINSIDGDRVSILEDLSQYDRVITRGHHGLKDQAAIVLRD